jgi:MFS superfamily sulfate permease-like transporter
VNFAAGAQTALSNIIMSLVVMVVLLALTPLFKYTPIAAVTGLIDVKAAYHIWKVDKFDFLAVLGAFFGVLFVSVEIGLLIAVSTLSFKYMKNSFCFPQSIPSLVNNFCPLLCETVMQVFAAMCIVLQSIYAKLILVIFDRYVSQH